MAISAKEIETAVKKALESRADATLSTAEANWQAYTRARDNGHRDYVERDQRANRYYNNDQWSASDLAKLEQHKRPALTINMVKPMVNAFLGQHVMQRTDISFRPRSRDAKSDTADALNKLWMQVSEQNQMRHRAPTVFADGLIGSRGYFNTRIDFTNNLNGELVIDVEDPTQVLLDPDARAYDPREWNQVIRAPWCTLDDIAVLYGEQHAAELQARAYTGSVYASDMMMWGRRFGSDMPPQTEMSVNGEQQRSAIRAVRVIDRQWRKLVRVREFVDLETGDTQEIPPSWDHNKINDFRERFGLEVVERIGRRIRWTVTAGDVTLHDDWSPYGEFTVVPFFAFWRPGHPGGLVEDLISSQDQLNKASSQELHIANSTANSGYYVPAGSLVNMTVDELEARGAETGLILEYNPKDGHVPEKIQPNQIPTAVSNIANKALSYFQMIAAVDPSMTGSAPERVSGVALEKRRAGTLSQMEVPFSNFRHTMEILARVALDQIQRFYDDTRVIQVQDPDKRVSGQGVPEEVTLNGVDEQGNVVNDLLAGRYEVTVSIVPARNTFEDEQYAEALQLREAGVLVPDDTVIEYSHLADRTEVAERVRSIQGTGEPSEEELQIQQAQIQLQLQRIQAENRKLTAESARLEADAIKKTAEAQNEEAKLQLELKEHTDNLQVSLAKIEASLKEQAASLQNKIDLARVHTQSNLQKTLFESASKRAMAEKKSASDERIALLHAATHTTSGEE